MRIRTAIGDLLLWLVLVLPAVIAFAPIHIPATSVISSTCLNARRNIFVLSHNVSQDVADGYFDVNALLTGRVDVLARCVNSGLWVSNGIRKDTSVFLMLFPHNITIEVRGEELTDLNPDERTTALFLQRTLLVGDASAASDDDLLSSAAAAEIQERRQLELSRLQERDLKRPETVNPHKPGSLSKSEKKAFRTIRKAREAMIRRIQRSAGEGAPNGFIFHKNDTLEARLSLLEGNALMMDELGEPLGDVLADANMSVSNKHEKATIILGNQIGYSPCDEKLLAECDAVTKVSLGPLSLLTSQCITITHHCLDMRGN